MALAYAAIQLCEDCRSHVDVLITAMNRISPWRQPPDLMPMDGELRTERQHLLENRMHAS